MARVGNAPLGVRLPRSRFPSGGGATDTPTDGSDELFCATKPTFTCGDGYEIPLSWRCDGWADCPDPAAEANCG
jgi:hypothetical protein